MDETFRYPDLRGLDYTISGSSVADLGHGAVWLWVIKY